MGIVVQNLEKSLGNPPRPILSDINLEIKDGEFISFIGRSGSGKSTLLYLLSTLDIPSKGDVVIDGNNVHQLDKEHLYRIRNQQIGFVFQFHYLLAELTALENLLMPARKYGELEEKEVYARDLLCQFGLGDKINRLPRQLSGGEQQRVAIARALVMKPKYLFADEPTGSLDSVNSEKVMEIFFKANADQGTTVIMVTHDSDFANMAKRQIHLTDGRITR
jgi:ABC-type lipoprotein export system ATPase subunit